MSAKTLLARRGLPDQFNAASAQTPPQNALLASALLAHSFEALHGSTINESLKTALLAGSVAKVFSAVAEVLACDRTEVLLLQQKRISRNGQKLDVTYFRFVFNRTFDTVLKAAGETRFDGTWKARNLVVTETAIAHLMQPIQEQFRYVIDVNLLQSLKNLAPSPSHAREQVAFNLIPFHVQIALSEVMNDIQALRPQDKVEQLSIHTGTRFVSTDGLSHIWSRLPFLLLRYSVESGRPRYVSFSTLANTVERFAFGNEDKHAKRMIARYLDACRLLQTTAFETESTRIVLEQSDDRQPFQGNFSRFAHSTALVDRTFADLRFMPMVSDYTTLANEGYGADSATAGTIAYIDPNPEKRRYYEKLAAFFGEKSGAYPIIFSRAFLDKWSDLASSDFLETVAYELAHWLVIQDQEDEIEVNYPTDCKEGVHGIRWAIYADLIETLLLGREDWTTNYWFYHKDQTLTTGVIDLFVEPGVEALKQMANEQAVSKTQLQAIAQFVHRCVAMVVDFATTRNEQSQGTAPRLAPPLDAVNRGVPTIPFDA